MKSALLIPFKNILGLIIFAFTITLPAQVTLVKDIWPGIGNALLNDPQLTVFNNNLYFSADDGVHGKELWKTDGTEAGTVMVKDINPGSLSSNPTQFTISNNQLFFVATDPVFGRELWKTDGTDAGTVLVKDINPSNDNTHQISGLIDYNGTLFFAANNGINGIELWKSNGTENSTIMVRDIYPGALSSSPANFSIHGGFLYFTATGTNPDGVLVGRELFRTTGDELGTMLVVNSFPGGSSINPNSSNPSVVVSLGENPYFTANVPIPNSTTVSRRLCTIGGNSDLQIVSAAVNPLGLTKSGSLIYYTSSMFPIGNELYASNGSGDFETDNLILNIWPGNSSNPTGLTDFNGILIFSASNGVTNNGTELWRSNGSGGGTYMIKDIRPGTNGSSPTNITRIQDKVFFRANDGVHGNELWVTDGTEDGTYMVADINQGSGFSEPFAFTEYNGFLYFVANAGNGTGYELYKIDLNTLSNNSFNSIHHVAYFFDNKSKELNISRLEDLSKIKIYNVSGLLVKDVESNDSEMKINLQGLSSGVYIFTIQSEGKNHSKKFIIN